MGGSASRDKEFHKAIEHGNLNKVVDITAKKVNYQEGFNHAVYARKFDIVEYLGSIIGRNKLKIDVFDEVTIEHLAEEGHYDIAHYLQELQGFEAP